MPESNTFYLHPLRAEDALKKWAESAIGLFGNSSITANFGTNISNFQISFRGSAQSLPEQPEFKKFAGLLSDISSPIICNRFTLQYSQHSLSTTIVYERKAESVYAKIAIENEDDAERLIGLYKKLSTIFLFVERNELILHTLPVLQQDAIKYQQSTLSQLQAETSKIAHFNLQQSKDLTEFLMKATAQTEERARQREDEFEQKRKLNDEIFSAREKALEEQNRQKLIELEKREEEHKRKVAEIDARENMVIRRQLLKQITDLITGQLIFTLSPSTVTKRDSVRKTCLYSIIGASLWIAFFMGTMVISVYRGSEPRWYQYAPLPVGIIFLISTIGYYIKWSDQWAREHAQAEIRTKKLNTDILRASWLAEMFFEGKDKERLLPDMLLSRFSEGLFTETLTATPENPADQLTDLLKKISSVKVSKEAVEVTKSAAEEKK